MTPAVLLGRLRGSLRSYTGRNAIMLLGAQILIALSGFLFWVLVARLFEASAVGFAASLISSSALVAQASVLGVNQSLVRFLPGSVGPDRGRLLTTGLGVVAVAALVVGAVTFAVLALTAPAAFQGRLSLLAMLFLVNSLGTACVAVTDAAMLAVGASGRNLVGYLVGAVARVSLPLLAAPWGTAGVLAVNALTQFVVVGFALLHLTGRCGLRLGSRIDGDQVRSLARFAGSNYVAGIAWTAPLMALPTLNFHLLDPETA
ncbi:MAG: hypothetical protein Q4F67_15860, partial [Propionibacteriaceae bacterium]|nr:hypothetical protein [Propionibacteriaceae bacterium]